MRYSTHCADGSPGSISSWRMVGIHRPPRTPEGKKGRGPYGRRNAREDAARTAGARGAAPAVFRRSDVSHVHRRVAENLRRESEGLHGVVLSAAPGTAHSPDAGSSSGDDVAPG